MTYPAYARPPEFVDIPAAPGYRVRSGMPTYSYNRPWQHVIAWRVPQEGSAYVGGPIVLGGAGPFVLTRAYSEQFEYLLPGQEEDQ